MGDTQYDGICCNYGKGNVTITSADGDVLWYSNGTNVNQNVYMDLSATGDLESVTTFAATMDDDFVGLNFTDDDDWVEPTDDAWWNSTDDIFSFEKENDPEFPGPFPSSGDQLMLNIKTDLHPEEITWSWDRLNDDGSWDDENVGGPYNEEEEKETLISTSLPTSTEKVYRLRVFDSGADGTCCSYGKGWFSLTDNANQGTVVWAQLWDQGAGTEDSLKELVVYFAVDADDKVQEVVPAPGGGYATATEIVFMGDEDFPGAFPTAGGNTVVFNLKTDNFPGETTWRWYRLNDDGSWDDDRAGGPYDENLQLISVELPASPNTTYRLTVSDSRGDGSCCGFGAGWFTLTNSSIPEDGSEDEGTIFWSGVWSEADEVEELNIYVAVDSEGNTQHVVPNPFEGGYSPPSELASDYVFDPSHDEQFPGAYPEAVNDLVFNIMTDEFPFETTWSWGRLNDDGSWDDDIVGGPYDDELTLESTSLPVSPDTTYRLSVADLGKDGTCCKYGTGWFSLTNSTISEDDPEGLGTVLWSHVWKERDDEEDTEYSLEELIIYLSSDAAGHAQMVVPIGGGKYARPPLECCSDVREGDFDGRERCTRIRGTRAEYCCQACMPAESDTAATATDRHSDLFS